MPFCPCYAHTLTLLTATMPYRLEGGAAGLILCESLALWLAEGPSPPRASTAPAGERRLRLCWGCVGMHATIEVPGVNEKKRENGVSLATMSEFQTNYEYAYIRIYEYAQRVGILIRNN